MEKRQLSRLHVFPQEEYDHKDRSPVSDSQKPFLRGVAGLVVQSVHGSREYHVNWRNILITLIDPAGAPKVRRNCQREVEIYNVPPRLRGCFDQEPPLCPKLCPVAAWMGLVANEGKARKPAFLLANTNASKRR